MITRTPKPVYKSPSIPDYSVVSSTINMNQSNSSDKFTASDYRISTITVTGGINCSVCLEKLYAVLASHTLKEDISYLEYGANKHDLLSIGEKTKKTNKSKKINEKKATKRFDNQLTIVMHHMNNKYNIKLFKNGNIQITGVKSIDNGKKAIDFLIEKIKHLYKYDNDILVDDNIQNMKNVNYNVRLINSDFKIDFQIRLDYLYKLVLNKYNIICSYEPCIYPGAKIEYYYPNNGYCKCTGFCNGKTDQCKKITIAVFQSGCVIITGANKIEHIDTAYAFICRLLKENMNEIKRVKLALPVK